MDTRSVIWDRRSFLGGSDAYRVVHEPMTLWEEKTGRREPDGCDPEDDTDPRNWGRWLEGTVLDRLDAWVRRQWPGHPIRYERHPGDIMSDGDQPGYCDPTAPWRVAHLDEVVVFTEAGLAVIADAKTGFAVLDMDGQVNARIDYQMHHYHGVLARAGVYPRVAEQVLIPWFGHRFKMQIIELPIDVGLVEDLMAAEDRFWWHVQHDVRPEPRFAVEARRAWELHPSQVLRVPDDIEVACRRYAHISVEQSALEVERQRLADRIITFSGRARRLITRTGEKLGTVYDTKHSRAFRPADTLKG
jgi:hypothetical protein